MGKYSHRLLSPALGPNGELILDLTNDLLLQPRVPALQLGIKILQFHTNNQKHITEQMYVADTYHKYKERTTCIPRPRAIQTHVHTLQVQIPARHPECAVNKGRGRSKEQRLKQTAAKTNITSRTGQTLGLGG